MTRLGLLSKTGWSGCGVISGSARMNRVHPFKGTLARRSVGGVEIRRFVDDRPTLGTPISGVACSSISILASLIASPVVSLSCWSSVRCLARRSEQMKGSSCLVLVRIW